jgi:hypothetical protein
VNLFVRASVLGTALIGLTGQAPPMLAGEGADFCVRLAKNIGIDTTKAADGKSGWTANALNFGQRFLVGGTASTSVDVEPAEPATVDDYKRASGMCTAEGKGAICRLVGPANFKFGWKGNTSITPVLPDERAIVRVEGIKTNCQPDTAPAAAQ